MEVKGTAMLTLHKEIWSQKEFCSTNREGKTAEVNKDMAQEGKERNYHGWKPSFSLRTRFSPPEW